jgi:hypothetical protein
VKTESKTESEKKTIWLPPEILSQRISEKVTLEIWKGFQDTFFSAIHKAAEQATDTFVNSRNTHLWSMVERHFQVLKDDVARVYETEIKRLKLELETAKSDLEKEKAESAKKDQVNNTLRELVKKKNDQAKPEDNTNQ